MSIDLQIETLKIITEKSQNSIERLLRKSKPLTQTLKFVQLLLGEMKSEIYEWLCSAATGLKDPNKLISKLTQLKSATDQDLAKHRLYFILKKKLSKLKNQSFLHSIDSNSSVLSSDTKIQSLQKSIIHIEKDLQIEPEEEESFGLSTIIQKSRLHNIDNSNIKDDCNISAISGYEEFKFNPSFKKQFKGHESLSASFIQEPSENILKQSQIEPTFSKNQQSNIIQQPIKQCKDKDLQSSTPKTTSQSKEPEGIKTETSKLMKKKKKTVYTNAGSSINKQDLLGNLLEESVQQCLDNQKK